MIVIDCEVYRNFFLFAAMNTANGRIYYTDNAQPGGVDRNMIRKIMDCPTASFNGNNYDLLMITAALKGYSTQQIKELSDTIIVKNKPGWMVTKDNNLKIPKWDHIDLIEVSPGRAGLKIYGGRLGSKTIQDLPVDPSKDLTEEDIVGMRSYCGNDLVTTAELYEAMRPQLALREQMSKQYGMDLRSKSDAQIAETVIISELEALTKRRVQRPQVDRETFRYNDPKIVNFKTPALQAMFERILKTEFTLGGNGSVTIPAWLKNERIEIGGRKYQMGIGGLHSCEKSQLVRGDEHATLCELDVASYYPNIILQQQLAPDSLGTEFLDVYRSIVERRLAAKKSGDKVTADVLKIAVNGSFGKLGSKYSKLYAPELLIQTTITGQLCLLMLIERMEMAGFDVYSANTDGIVLRFPNDKEVLVNKIADAWMRHTTFTLERTDYQCLASRDVNNYVAVKTAGDNNHVDVKGKGVFASAGLAKNPDASIIPKAVAAFIAFGTPVAETIRNCENITDFCIVRRVTGGGVWRGEYLGKAVRYYWSNQVDGDAAIRYEKNNNTVPKSAGSRPIMTLPDALPEDIDYDRYVAAALKMVEEVGYTC